MIVKNITLLGHKDHGKSTTIGNLLILTKTVTQDRINEAKRISRELGRQFEPGYILDSFSEERENEMTIDTTRAELVHKDLAFAFIDVPGHEELIKNMISGASYAEIALLMVSAKKEEGIREQTKRHIFIARMLGIDKLIVAVNKMDLIGYDHKKFHEMCTELAKFIERVGFKRSNVFFVPISAYNGDNLVKRSKMMKWYKGKPVLDLLYVHAKGEDTRLGRSALRVVAQGFIDPERKIIVGKVVSGKISVGSNINILPIGATSKVSAISVKGKRVRTARINDDVAIHISTPISKDVRGTVIVDSSEKPLLTDKINSLIFVTAPIRRNLKIKVNGSEVACKKFDVIKHIDTTTGEPMAESKIEPLDAIRSRITLSKKVPIENFESLRELGRFVLYSEGKFAGIGIVE
ncbi:MAG: hypothetical protein KGH52_02655 [Candidatus Micrarchaeota archaeon]|nr:hypothetical protein [Candidatus Micrarchaeota archaeon]